MICLICGKAKARVKGRCGTCYIYLRRRGEDRPKHLFDFSSSKKIVCSNCGQLIEHYRPRLGLCWACYNYQQRTGNARPKRKSIIPRKPIIPIGERHCACGKVAVKSICVSDNWQRRYVCSDCFEQYRHQADLGDIEILS